MQASFAYNIIHHQKKRCMKLLKCLAFLSLAILLGTSCQKDTPPPTTSTAPDSYVKNIANPLDSIGLRHNIVLDSLLKDFFLAGLSRDDLYKKTFDYFEPEFPDITYNSLYVANKPMWDELPSTSDLSSLLTGKGLNPQAAHMAQDMLDSIDLAANSEELAEMMKGMELQIINSSTLDSLTRTQLLCATAVARYSSNYWDKNIESWINASEVPPAGEARSWKKHAKEDCKGAIGGATAGIVEGPVGVVAGGLLGAAGTSLASWLFD